MDIGPIYKPNFRTEDIKTVNDIFGHEFFKMPENSEKNNNGKSFLPDGREEDSAKTRGNNSEAEKNMDYSETEDISMPDDRTEQENNEWHNFFNDSKDIKP